MNVVMLSGNVVDPGEVKTISSDSRVRTIRIAVNLAKDKALFLDVEVWNGWAENFRGKKGDPLVIVGELSQSHWEKDGEKKSRTYVKSREVRLLVPKPDDLAA